MTLRITRFSILLRAAPFAVLGVALAAAASASGGVSVKEVEASFRNSRLEREFRFAQAHPGEVWFLANPLVTLYTDRKLYHQGYGVYDRVLAGKPPSEAQLSVHRPANLRWIATPGSPFWCPAGLSPIAAPEGLSHYRWFAPR